MPHATLTAPTALHRPWRAAAAYGLMLAVGLGLFFLINHFGQALAPPAATAVVAVKAPGQPVDVLPHLLLALAAVLVVGRLLGWAFAAVGQPPVIGEVVAGIALGPSLLGRVWPEATAFLLPAEVVPFLSALAQLGVTLYMFLVGLELNAAELKGRGPAVVAISHASILAPFLLGAALALLLYTPYAPAGVPFTSFALFVGAALAVTAFPVLARILADRGLTHTPLGVVALSCAAADDVTAWCLLALVVGVAQAQVGSALVVSGLALAYIALLFGLVRPLAARLVAKLEGKPIRPGHVAALLAAVLLSALATEAIGVHAVFGAFLLGAVIPADSKLAHTCRRQCEGVVTLVLLPAFFASTGLRTEIGLVSGAGAWLACGLIVLAATLGKFGGTVAAGRATGLGWRTSAGLGALMNTRGLMALIVLNVGLNLGVLTPTLFAMMVLMAVATTLMTAPLLSLFHPQSRL
jgi:Kef-type K+ transport system membrane component KefB